MKRIDDADRLARRISLLERQPPNSTLKKPDGQGGYVTTYVALELEWARQELAALSRRAA